MWEDGEPRQTVVSEMLAASAPQGEGPARKWDDLLATRPSDAAVGRAIQKIIDKSKK